MARALRSHLAPRFRWPIPANVLVLRLFLEDGSLPGDFDDLAAPIVGNEDASVAGDAHVFGADEAVRVVGQQF